MTAVQEHVVLPPDNAQARDALAEIAEMISGVMPELLGGDGRRVPLSGPVRDVLFQVVNTLREGNAVTIGPFPTLLTTQQAAHLLGVSRPTLIKILDDGRLPYERPGDHRRLRLEDVLEFRARQRLRRERSMTELVRQTEELGLYEDGS